MVDLLPLLIAGVLILTLAAFLINRSLAPAEKRPVKEKKKVKDRDTIIKEANRRLAANPKDPEALISLGDLYYSESDFDKAMKAYQIVINMGTGAVETDEFQLNLRFGLSCLKCGLNEEAYKALVLARSMKPDAFEANYNLGYLEFQRKNYDKAVALLRQALVGSPDHSGSVKFLGQGLYKIKRYKEAVPYLRKAIDFEPNDKETLFYMAQTYYELGQVDNALKIFVHLRPDPLYGPQSALMAGIIHFNQRNFDASILDLEIGLRHQSIPQDTWVEMKYRLAAAHTQNQDLEKSIRQLREIYAKLPSYKDVAEQLRKLSEYNSNRNLQTYMVAPASEFVTLCRNLTMTFFPKAAIKIVDVAVNKNEYADITAEVSTSKWEDVILFRYLRSTSETGEFFLRDLHARIKEVRAGRGFCVTAGTFNNTAKAFVEARLIDLVEKPKLLKLLESLH